MNGDRSLQERVMFTSHQSVTWKFFNTTGQTSKINSAHHSHHKINFNELRKFQKNSCVGEGCCQMIIHISAVLWKPFGSLLSGEVVHEMMCSLCLVSPLRLVGTIQLDELRRPECHRGVNHHLMLCVRDYRQTKSIIS